jgi:hypothetical protein
VGAASVPRAEKIQVKAPPSHKPDKHGGTQRIAFHNGNRT